MSTTTVTERPPALASSAPAVDLETITDAEKKELIQADTVSIASDATTLSPSSLAFEPVKTLVVSARGIDMFRLPTPSKEMQINILDRDGTVVYQSTRAVRSSGNADLTDAIGSRLIVTEYFFGPSKDPVLHVVDNETGESEDIKTTSKWTSRHHTFLLPNGRTLKWEYKRERGFGGTDKKGTALVMTVDGQRTAALIRNDETRTLGAKSCTAGNGGELVLGEFVGIEKGVSEPLVVASCLLMLKKEIDRRRTVQFMMIAAAVS